MLLFTENRNKCREVELYNAVSGKRYTDPEMLEINTLENAIYMAMKNDLSFIIDARLSLYEHQSTYSPNLPFGIKGSYAECQQRAQQRADENEPYLVGIRGIYGESEKICGGNGTGRGSREGYRRVYKGRDIERISGEELSGGKEHEYI